MWDKVCPEAERLHPMGMRDGGTTMSSSMRVHRPIYHIDEFNEASDYNERRRKTFCEKLKRSYRRFDLLSCITTAIPSLAWLPEYSIVDDLFSDIIAGMTVAVMHVPQGLAYSTLGNVPPIFGIYMAFFPVLVYFFLGTSRHISIGTFAVVCLMSGKVVSKFSNITQLEPQIISNFTQAEVKDIGEPFDKIYPYSAIEVATAITLVVGIYQIIMYICGLGMITTFLSESLVNGFVTGAAYHVLSTQLCEIFGLQLPKRWGIFKVIHTVMDICQNIHETNLAALTMSTVCMVLLMLHFLFLRPYMLKRTRIPLPIELVIITLGTAFSYFLNMKKEYALRIVGEIPTGFPTPELPNPEVLRLVAVDCIAIALVSYIITVSMALIFSAKLGYLVDSNQECLALGAGNVCGSFFSCLPVCASLSRSMIQQTVGGQTQVVSIVSCSILVIVLLWVGPFFEELPRCVLGSIIIFALKGMLMEVTQIKQFIKLSTVDSSVWGITFLTVVIFDIDIGLLVGIISSLVVLLLKGLSPYTCMLGVIPGTDLYADMKRHKRAEEIPNIKIYHYAGGLSYAQCKAFKRDLFFKIRLDPIKVYESRIRELKRRNKPNRVKRDVIVNQLENSVVQFYDEPCVVPFVYLIWDVSAVSYIDPTGVKELRQLAEHFGKINVIVFVAGLSGPLFEAVKRSDEFEHAIPQFYIFPTVHDAVLYAQHLIKTLQL